MVVIVPATAAAPGVATVTVKNPEIFGSVQTPTVAGATGAANVASVAIPIVKDPIAGATIPESPMIFVAVLLGTVKEAGVVSVPFVVTTVIVVPAGIKFKFTSVIRTVV
jgi:hypothetical protein